MQVLIQKNAEMLIN